MQTFDDRGVSESLGYILVFAIVLTGIAGIVFFGTTMLNDAKDRNNFQNVEQGLTVVHSDLKRVAMEKAPVKTSKLHVDGGSMSTNFSSASIRVDFNGNVYDNVTGDITYYSNSGQKTLSLENGGLWKTYGGTMGDVSIVSPRIFASPSNQALVINVIRLTGTDTAFASSGTTNVIMEYVGNNVYTYQATPYADVTLTVNTAYPNAWYRFIYDSIGGSIGGFAVTPVNVSDTWMKATISNVSRVIVSEHTIKIQPFTMTM